MISREVLNCSKCGSYAVTYNGKHCVSIRSGAICGGKIERIMKRIIQEGVFRLKDATVIVAKECGRWHLSISCQDHQPSYKLIKESRYLFLPEDIVMAQIFPPKSEFINLHPYCHHLWQIFPQDEMPPDYKIIKRESESSHD